MRLLLEEVIEDGYRPLATLEGRPYRVGRDLTTDVPLSSNALSRQHGLFAPFESGWIFKDLGSTNGSWHNGNKLKPHVLTPLKEGDFLQLADSIVRVKYLGATQELRGPRLMVMKDGVPVDEFVLSVNAPEITIGDAQSSLVLAGYIGDEPAARFSFAHGSIILSTGGFGRKVILNGEDFSAPRYQVVRGDSITVGEYECVYVDTQLVRFQGEPRPVPIIPAQPFVDLTEVSGKSSTSNLQAESKPQVFSPVHTVAIKPDSQRVWRFGETPTETEDDPWDAKVPPRKFATHEEKSPLFDFERMTDAERRLVFGIIFFLGATVLLFLIWLLFL